MTKRVFFTLCLIEIALVHTACFETSPQGCETETMDDGSVVLVCGDDAPVTIQGPQGEQGKQGEQGEQGEAGEPGVDGADGVSTVLRVEDATAEQCMYGGTVVFSGGDADADGELDPEEEAGSFVVCQGVPGEATAPVIVPSDADIAECPTGGKQLDVGVDDDQSGALEAEEIDQSFVICNGEVGAAGASSLVKVTVDGASGCEGDLIETGLDSDDSGTLDMLEVDSAFEVCDGDDGLNAILRVNEGAATTCAVGGDVLEFGLDVDGSGTLEAAEVSASFEVCDGADGVDGADGMDGAPGADGVDGADGMDGMDGLMGYSSLVRLTPEPAGANCAQGGQLLEVGIDNGDGGGTERNNVLEAGEVDSSTYVCNGADGAPGADGADGMDGAPGADGADGADGQNALIKTSQESPGANCASGGLKIETGIDADNSGTLDAGEVDAAQTQYLCSAARPVVVKSSTGGAHSCAVMDNGEVYCWGSNNNGQLGDGTTTNRQSPVKVSGISTATGVALGNSHTCARLSGGAVRCWGSNVSGQLGNNTTTNSTTPVAVSSVATAAQLALGSAHSCARLNNGTVRCWGSNGSGQLGNGTTTDSAVPVTVSAISAAKDLDGGLSHTCAIAGASAEVFCWGFNVFGQLGNGGNTDSSTPVSTGLTSMAAVSTGLAHSCAVSNAGAVQCWGVNASGQLGDGTTANQTSPVAVTGISDAKGIALGNSHSCVILDTGAVQCWGVNASGQLGNGTTTDSLTPVDVFGISQALTLSVGAGHTCVLSSTGYIECWGQNTAGQLGNGTTANSAVPVYTIFF